jgi:hypothetical protein
MYCFQSLTFLIRVREGSFKFGLKLLTPVLISCGQSPVVCVVSQVE